MDLETAVDFFKIFYFVNSIPEPNNESIKINLQTLTKLRESIISFQRIFHLHHEFQKGKWKRYLPSFIPPNDFLFKPYSIRSIRDISLFSQNTTFLLGFINANPRVLAQAVIKVSSDQHFSYLINGIIPSVFGFFSSEEHTNNALGFYIHIVDISPPQIAKKILYSFFNNALAYRFLESVFTPFFNIFYRNFSTVSKSSCPTQIESVYQTLSNTFLNLMIGSLPLFPEQYLQMFRIIWIKGWDRIDVHDLFFKNFIWEVADRWIDSTPASKYKIHLSEVISYVNQQEDKTNNFFDLLFRTKSVWRQPMIYYPFGEKYISYYLCVHDVCYLASILEDYLPSSLGMENFCYLENYSSFWCQWFPKSDPSLMKEKPILFEVLKKPVELHQYSLDVQQKFLRRYKTLSIYANDNHLDIFQVINQHSEGEFKTFCHEELVKEMKESGLKLEKKIHLLQIFREAKDWMNLVNTFLSIMLIPKFIPNSQDSGKKGKKNFQLIFQKEIKNNPLSFFQQLEFTFPTKRMKKLMFLNLMKFSLKKYFLEGKSNFDMIEHNWDQLWTKNVLTHNYSSELNNSSKEKNIQKLKFCIESINAVPFHYKFDYFLYFLRCYLLISSLDDRNNYKFIFFLGSYKEYLKPFIKLRLIMLSVPENIFEDEEILEWKNLLAIFEDNISCNHLLQNLIQNVIKGFNSQT